MRFVWDLSTAANLHRQLHRAIQRVCLALLRLQQTANFLLPRKTPYKLVEVKRCVHRAKQVAVRIDDLYIRRHAHRVYHCYNAASYFDPVPG